MKLDTSAINRRREAWYAATRGRLPLLFNPDGSGRIPQFEPPYREPLWILPALYTGDAEHVDLANRIAGRYTDAPPVRYKNLGETSGRQFGIFQSTVLATLLNRFADRISPAARRTMQWHARQVFKTFRGAAQPDYKFHGANDNMPMMATCGLILGGEIMGNAQAVLHGYWNLNQLRRLLSRAAWASEYNSSTYSAITLAGAAKIATLSRSAEIRRMARRIEARLWAEVLLHYHPGTLRQAGPQSRAYCIDYAGHTHTLQMVLWTVFGSELTGRDPIASYFHPDGREVLHFEGNPYASIAEFCDAVDTDFHVPPELAELIRARRYPALLRGCAEGMRRFDGQGARSHTQTYMEPDFSLGTVNGPFCGGEQTASLYATYRRRPRVRSFRDSASVFFKYLDADVEIGKKDASVDGHYAGEHFFKSRGWCYTLQKRNVALLLCTPDLTEDRLRTDTLKLDVVFPAHYGRLRRTVIGDGRVRNGAQGESADVAPVSGEAGEVYVHVQPLIPTSLKRQAAVRFTASHEYEILELVNYEGPRRTFARGELACVLNGMVLTVVSRSKCKSLKAFHKAMSDCLVVDYLLAGHRFFQFSREDAEFEVCLTTCPFGVQTEAVDGRTVSRPHFESSQIDVRRLPFMSGSVSPNFPFFPWKTLDICYYPDLPWMVGSRGLPEETAYSRRMTKEKDKR